MSSPIETAIRATVTKGINAVAGFNRTRLAATASTSPSLEGVHKPMGAELTLEGLTVTGSIPKELDGRYLRIGPNPATPPNPAAYHWFTGDGMVHGVRLKDGQALWYRNRWVRSKAVSKALGEPAAPGPRHGPSDTVNTNVLGHAGTTWALVEAGGYPVRLGEDLETLAHDPFGGTLAGGFSAHPHLDPDTGDMHAICYEATELNAIRHVVVNAQGKVKPEVIEARKRGVIFDIGHGMGSFSFKTARAMLANGFYPDTISSDVHALCIDGPAFDQVTTMSKFLCMGMPLGEVIKQSTVNAAMALKRPELGTFRPGSAGDATVLSIKDGKFDYVDVLGEHMEGRQRIVSDGVVIAGKWWWPKE
jgi:hypothetical protein